MRHLLAASIGLACAFGASASAGDAPAFRDFTFKRVGVPKKGARRITVQIDPSEQARLLAVPEPVPPRRQKPESPVAPAAPAAPRASTPVGSLAWFWEDVPVNGMGPGGLEKVLGTLGNPRGRAAPVYRLESLRRIAEAHGATLLRETVGTKVSPALVLAVIAVESAGKAKAKSHAGAQGLMQLMPATAQRFGVTDSYDADQNIRGGVKYLHWLLERFGGDPILALAGYNAGEGAVDKHGGVPPYAETRDYVPKVLAAFAVARGLCVTPPVLVSDGCVFVGERVASAE